MVRLMWDIPLLCLVMHWVYISYNMVDEIMTWVLLHTYYASFLYVTQKILISNSPELL